MAITLNSKSYDGRYLKLTLTQTKNTSNNTSTINWTLESVGGSVNYYYTGPTTLTIDGQQAYFSARTGEHVFPCAKGSKSGTITVNHAADGSKSVAVSLSTAIYTKSVTTTSDTWVLESNPRGATITMASNFNDEQNPTISFLNHAGSQVDKLEVCISADGTNPTVGYKTITDKSAIAYNFQLTDAERVALRRAVTTGSSKTVTYILRTTMGSNVFTDKAERTLTLINHEPVVSMSVLDNNPDTVALTGNASRFIKGYSTASYTITATARKEASIVSYFCNGGQSSATDSVLNVTTNQLEYGAIDSRGVTTTAIKPITLIDYNNVRCNGQKVGIELDNETDAIITVKVDGSVFNGSFGNVANELFIWVYYKEAGMTDWMGYVPITEAYTPTFNGNSFTLTAPLPRKFDYSKSWTIETVVFDRLSRATAGEYTVNLTPVFDWSSTDFNFNVDINVNGSSTFGGDMNVGGDLTVDGNVDVGSLTFMGSAPILVVQEGESNGWYFRKWSNGVGECWKSVEHSTTIKKSWGDMYVGDTLMERQNYPFAFTSKPIETVTLLNGSNAGWVFAESQGNGVNGTYASAIYNVCRPSSVSTAQTFYINLYVRGKYA